MKKYFFLIIAVFSIINLCKAQQRSEIVPTGITDNNFVSINHSGIYTIKTHQEPVNECVQISESFKGHVDCRASLSANHFASVNRAHPLQSTPFDSTKQLIALVKDATELVRIKGEAAFGEFRKSGSRWRQGEKYIFVIDPQGNMLVNADPELEGRNQLNLKDINGKPIVRGLLEAVTTFSNKTDGWYHYQWPVPGGLLPRWKSSYVQLVKAPSGNNYIIGSGNYNDRMEREFVVDAVQDAVAHIQKNGEAAYKLFHDPAGPFMVKDAYIFVIDEKGIDLVNPAFPNLEGRNLMDLKDTHGKLLIKEMFKTTETNNPGWVDYMWPKPGESVSTQKSAYVSRAKIGEKWVLVGCGVYLADAPKSMTSTPKMSAQELMTLVRDAAKVFEERGEMAYSDFRVKGSRWYRDDTYFFVWTMDGLRSFHAADPASEGLMVSGLKDIHSRPLGQMILEAGASPEGEGWIHYMYPEPGDIFPTWKSSFIKRVSFPSGKKFIIGCGIYNMTLDKVFIEDVVTRAAKLVAERGKDAFGELRDKTGSFVFMDTYVFVDNPDGIELVNPGQPSLEGKNLINEKDVRGKAVIREYIAVAMKKGSAWVDYYWYRPGDNKIVKKYTYVKKVQHGNETYILGSGLYESN